MESIEEHDSPLIDLQRQRLSFLIKKSRKLETRLAELRSEDHQMELMNLLSLSDSDANACKEIKDLIDSVNQMKAEYYLLSYQKNVYSGLIPPGLIDYMPDQPVERTLTINRPVENHDNPISETSTAAQPHSTEVVTSNDINMSIDTPTTSSQALPKNSETNELQSWSCPLCSFKNHPLIDLCEICEHQRHHFDNSSPAKISKNANVILENPASKCSRCVNSTCYCHMELNQ